VEGEKRIRNEIKGENDVEEKAFFEVF